MIRGYYQDAFLQLGSTSQGLSLFFCGLQFLQKGAAFRKPVGFCESGDDYGGALLGVCWGLFCETPIFWIGSCR